VLEEDQERLLAAYGSQVEWYARRLAKFLPSGLDVDDLRQVGKMALLEAAARYEPARGATFRTFSGWRIHGAMIDELRLAQWVPRHPGVTHLMKVIASRQGQDLPITSEALAEATGQPVEKIREWEMRIAHGASGHLSLDEIRETRFEDGTDRPRPAHQVADESPNVVALMEERDRCRHLHATVDQLPDRVRTAISLYYFEDLTMIKIAALLRVTESRVSQIIAQGQRLLKPMLLGHVALTIPALQTCAWCRHIFVRGKITRDFCRAACKQAGLATVGRA